jgi:phage tail protein X
VGVPTVIVHFDEAGRDQQDVSQGRDGLVCDRPFPTIDALCRRGKHFGHETGTFEKALVACFRLATQQHIGLVEAVSLRYPQLHVVEINAAMAASGPFPQPGTDVDGYEVVPAASSGHGINQTTYVVGPEKLKRLKWG